MKWIFQLMEVFHVIYLHLANDIIVQSSISNLNEVRQKIILLFGGYALKVYEL